jgi:hypothetical protein
MVRREDSQDGVGVLALDEQGRQSASRGGVSGHRFLEDLSGGQTWKLIADFVGQILVGDDPGFFELCQWLEAFYGLLDHGAFPIQREHLFGAGAAGPGPEASTAASSENHRTKID